MGRPPAGTRSNLNGDWTLQNSRFAGYGVVTGYLPEQKIAVAVVTTYCDNFWQPQLLGGSCLARRYVASQGARQQSARPRAALNGNARTWETLRDPLFAADRSGRFSSGRSALGAAVIRDQRIGIDAEELFSVADTIAIGIGVEGIGAVDVRFVTIGDSVGVRVRVSGIQTEARLEVIGRVVRILIGGGGHRGVGRLRCRFRFRCWLRRGRHVLGDGRQLRSRVDHRHSSTWVEIGAKNHPLVGRSRGGTGAIGAAGIVVDNRTLRPRRASARECPQSGTETEDRDDNEPLQVQVHERP